MIFEGTGECSKVDWQFLGLTIANWSFLLCCGLLLALLVAAWRARQAR
jgi:protein dithiol:quinone oxidoreductase